MLVWNVISLQTGKPPPPARRVHQVGGQDVCHMLNVTLAMLRMRQQRCNRLGRTGTAEQVSCAAASPHATVPCH